MEGSTLEYLAALAAQLGDLARRDKLDFLAYLFGVAELEANTLLVAAHGSEESDSSSNHQTRECA